MPNVDIIDPDITEFIDAKRFAEKYVASHPGCRIVIEPVVRVVRADAR
jgi:hypothetical protein